MCALLAVGQLSAQTRTISGKVTDAKGSPIANASVLVRGTTTGTSTKADGTFTLTIPANAKSLSISSVEYEEQIFDLKKQTNFTVVLTQRSDALSEVVVSVPYGTVKKSAFTGSEATIGAKTIDKQQVTSITNAIDGLVAGVTATNGGGEPGDIADIRIRGIGSYSASNSPLYVVNGTPFDGNIAALNTNDIESVTVLKDAAAAALYGSRAANGVIMITTKKGNRGRTNINIKVVQGFSSREIPEYDRVGPKDYYETMWEASRNSLIYGSGLSATAAAAQASATLTDANHLVYNAYNVPGSTLVDPTTGKLNPNAKLLWDESWSDALFRTANRTNATLSISGGGDKSDYYLSMGYLNEQGTLKFSGLKRYTMRLNVNATANSWLTAGLNMDGGYSESNYLLRNGAFTSNPFYYSRNMGPIYPIYQHDPTTGAFIDSAGQHVLDWGIPSQMGARPYAENSNLVGSLPLDNQSYRDLNGDINTYLEAKFLKHFAFKTTLGATFDQTNFIGYQNNQYGDAQTVSGRSTLTSEETASLTANEVLSYSQNFGDHSLRALAGHENYLHRFNQEAATKTGFLFPGQTQLDNGSVTEGFPTSSEDLNTIESYFAQVNYDYKQRYLFSASYRRDGSSRFSDSSRWGNFYSAGLGWRISEEDFLKDTKWINELKLKASYGQQGNENIGLLYPYKLYFPAANNGTGGYLFPSRPASPSLKWENNQTLNVGADFTLFDRRLQGTIEYFQKKSSDLLFDVPIAISTGYASSYQNIGSLQNTGVEAQLGYNVIRQRNFDWRVDLNLSHYTNKFTKLSPQYNAGGGFVSGSKKIAVGHSIYDFWLKQWAGVDASSGLGLYYMDVLGSDGKPTGKRVLTDDITKASYYFVGSAIPDIQGGLSNSFRYKNFDLSFLFTFSYGGKYLDGNYETLMSSGTYGTAESSDILKRWQKPGDVTNVPRLQNATTQDGASSRFLFDRSYLSLKNVSLTYTAPKTLSDKLHIPGFSIFGTIDNAWLLTAKKGMDPQSSFDGTSDASYPPFRTVSFGLNFNL
jgi:TonB-linked SusC/RagA family outer membrane protein